MSSIISLKNRHTDATQKLILSTAIELLERSGVGELTVRAIAKQAGMSERTVFRYYAQRDELLNAVAAEVTRSLATPGPPQTVAELLTYPAKLYPKYEGKAELARAALHTDISERIREGAAGERWKAVARLVEEIAPHCTARERKLAAANISYFLSATTWNYYRFYFELSAKETIECAQTAIKLTVDELKRK